METKSFLNRCKDSGINYESVSNSRKNFVLLHRYLETGVVSIVAFSNFKSELWDVMFSHPRFSSCCHAFLITDNCIGSFGDVSYDTPVFKGLTLNLVKDRCLVNICKNVAEYLAVGEYALLKKSYFKSQAWFEKAKNSCLLGADILENY